MSARIDNQGVLSCLSWFKGKAHDKAHTAFLLLRQSEFQGFWLKGASRQVRAALNKAAVAKKVAAMADEYYQMASLDDQRNAWFKIHMGMEYADHYVLQIGAAIDVLKKKLPNPTDEQRTILVSARNFADAMVPVIELMDLLDSRRPPRVVVFKTLSRTVAANLLGDGLQLAMKTLREPEIEYVWMTEVAPDGTKFQVCQGIVKWPKGTRHGCSKYSCSRAGNSQCEACGHAIKNPFNWVPLLIDDARDNSPCSLWVGKDCAEKLFGCEVSGDALYSNGPGAAVRK